jgi:hypothetical protein
MPFPFELLLQSHIVVDDAVMHNRDLAGAVSVRMRVSPCWPSVRSPAGVTYTRAALDRLSLA